ncbi:riboflavin synthase [Galactobacter sp.]|uniref:riboflavin synthase n=1 Tax=Galactobacter sp. TaxID=2676125 RepID=UPI0025BA7D73|nr:riboflavin synthase [Galactobacter sp.]
MFTGIVQGLGTVISLTRHPDGSAVLRLHAGLLAHDLPAGGSLAVNGVCLTALPHDAEATAARTLTTETDADAADGWDFAADVMGETLSLTSLGALLPGDRVNLERALRPTDSLDGHVVQGHVDGTGSLVRRTDHARWVVLRFAVPRTLAPFTALKASVAVDGVSLTISGVSDPDADEYAATAGRHWFEVSLIPATLSETTLGHLGIGAIVNLEVDVMAKYAARLAAFSAHGQEVLA